MPPLGVEGATNAAAVGESQVDNAAESAIGVGLPNGDRAGGQPRTPAVRAE
jgi:hypothetical protein